MKLTKYALMAAGCAMFAACSSDEPTQEVAATDDAASTDAAGYVAIDIKLPQVSGLGSRAESTTTDGTPSYDDGEAQEYAVTNGIVIVFENGATEADATVVGTAPLTGMSWGSAQGNQNVTTSSSAVAKLSGVSVTGDETYSAVVVLNYNSNFPLPAVGTTFGTWSTTASTFPMTITADNKTYLTMTNAALLASGASAPTVLTAIDKTKIKATEAEALAAGKAASFYVQRAVAKVSTKFNSSYTPTGEDYTSDKVQILSWMCDITNKTGYPVQVTEGLNSTTDYEYNYPNIWSTPRFLGEGTPTRVYWGKDPNYVGISETQTSQYFNEYTAADLDQSGYASGNPQYILENTFGINDQNTWETTRIILKANYTPNGFSDGDTYYRLNGDNSNYTYNGIIDVIKRQIVLTFNKEGDVKLGSAANTPGYYSLSDFTITIDGTAATTDQLNSLAVALGLASSTDEGFATYEGGITYYQARIKHFGDDLTPWQLGDDTYGNNNEKWLGRYGVVRNNSYEVQINSVSSPGSPIVPPIEPGPDDESNYYISVTVNLLSWAKRVQNVDL